MQDVYMLEHGGWHICTEHSHNHTHLQLADACTLWQVDAPGLSATWQLVEVVENRAVPGGGVLLEVPELKHKALQRGVQPLHLGVPAARQQQQQQHQKTTSKHQRE